METRIILGYPSHAKDAKPFLVYLGNEGSIAQIAMACSAAARFEIHQGQGRRKNNPNYDPEAVKAEVALSKLTPLILKELEELTYLREKVAAFEKEKADAEAKAKPAKK